jgi:hypothetical protein
MARHPFHPNATTDPGRSRRSQRLFAATRQDRLTACDDDDGDEDWDGPEGDPMTGPIWDPFELDDDEPQPEYGDFWDDPDEFED